MKTNQSAIIWMVLLLLILCGGYYIFHTLYQDNNNNHFKVISLKPYGAKIKIDMAFQPSDACVLSNYMARLSIYADDSNYEKKLKNRANHFLDSKKYYRNQEDEITVIFTDSNQSDAITINHYSFGSAMYFFSESQRNTARTTIAKYRQNYPVCQPLNILTDSVTSNKNNKYYLMAEDK